MNFWLERSKKEPGTIYAAAEQTGSEGFVALHAGKRELLHAASFLSAAALLLRLNAKRGKRVRLAQKSAALAEKNAARAQKAALRRIRGIGRYI